MENNNSMSTKTQNSGTEPQARTFTQEEVNKMMAERVGRVKAEKEQEYNSKLAELKERELKLQAKEILRDKKMPDSLLEAVNCSDIETFNNSIKIIEDYINGVRNEPVKIHGAFVPGYSGGMEDPERAGDAIAKAMGLASASFKKK